MQYRSCKHAHIFWYLYKTFFIEAAFPNKLSMTGIYLQKVATGHVDQWQQ